MGLKKSFHSALISGTASSSLSSTTSVLGEENVAFDAILCDDRYAAHATRASVMGHGLENTCKR